MNESKFESSFQNYVGPLFAPSKRTQNQTINRTRNYHSSVLKPRTINSYELRVPLSDWKISANLDLVLFPHPFTLIGILQQEWDPPTRQDITTSLLPYSLKADFSFAKERSLPIQISRIYKISIDSLTLPNDIAEKANLYWNNYLGQLCANQISILPKSNWELRTLDDLHSLHILACYLDTKIYLILPRKHSNSLVPPSVYSYFIGPTDSPNHLWVVCQSSNSFYLAFPQYKDYHFAATRSFFSIYEMSKHDFNHVILTDDDTNYGDGVASIHCSKSNSRLYRYAFSSLFITDTSFSSSELSNFQITISHKNKIINSSQITCPNHLSRFFSFLSELSFSSGSLSEANAFRLLAGTLSPNDMAKLKSVTDKSAHPLFLPNSNKISLLDLAESSYAELLCIRSILTHSVGRYDRICSFCKGMIVAGEVMHPYHSMDGKVRTLEFMCDDCFQNGKRIFPNWRQIEADSKSSFPFFSRSLSEQEQQLEIVNDNIAALHSTPIGPLAEMIDLIDTAFVTLQQILTVASLTDCSIESLLGIRDSREAAIQLGVTLVEANSPVDFSMFSRYLRFQADVQKSAPQFCLVQTPKAILDNLDTQVVTKLLEQFDHPGPPYTINVSDGDKFEVSLSIDKQIEYKKYVYSITENGRVIATIKSHMRVEKVWSGLLVLAHEEVEGNPYVNTYLYEVSPGNTNLANIKPIWQFKEPLRIVATEYNPSTKFFALSYSSLSDNFVESGIIPGELAQTTRLVHSFAIGPSNVLYSLEQDGSTLRLICEECEVDPVEFEMPDFTPVLFGTQHFLAVELHDMEITPITVDSEPLVLEKKPKCAYKNGLILEDDSFVEVVSFTSPTIVRAYEVQEELPMIKIETNNKFLALAELLPFQVAEEIQGRIAFNGYRANRQNFNVFSAISNFYVKMYCHCTFGHLEEVCSNFSINVVVGDDDKKVIDALDRQTGSILSLAVGNGLWATVQIGPPTKIWLVSKGKTKALYEAAIGKADRIFAFGESANEAERQWDSADAFLNYDGLLEAHSGELHNFNDLRDIATRFASICEFPFVPAQTVLSRCSL